jgi:hypothetical protein
MSGCFAISLCAFGTDVKSHSPIASGDYSASRLAAKVTGYDRTVDLEKCLKKNGIRVLYGKNGQPFTTLDAINAALGLKAESIRTKEEIDIL